MASTLEMLIRAKYISSGAGSLEAELKSIKNAINDLRKSDMTVDINKFLPSAGDLGRVQQELSGVVSRLAELQQAQLAAFGSGGAGGRLAGSVLQTEIKDLERYQKTLESIISTASQGKFNAADYILSESDTSAVVSRVENIKQRLASLQEAVAKANLLGDKTAAGSFQDEIKGLETLRKSYESVLKTIEGAKTFNLADYVLSPQDATGLQSRLDDVRAKIELLKNAVTKATLENDPAAKGFFSKELREAENAERTLRASVKSLESIKVDPDNFLFAGGTVDSVRLRIKQMESDIENFKRSAAAAFAQNTTESDSAGQAFLSQAENIGRMKTSLEQTVPAIEKTGFSIESLLTNKLTRLGFGIFTLQASLRTFTQLAGGLFDTLLEGASSLDRSRSFEILLSGEGISPSAMSGKLQQASQGLLTLDEAMAKTIQLTKAGFPEIAKNSDQLLKIATNAAIVSGDISQAGVVYDKLIRGIIRGSPRLIDDADIILKLGDANEKYAASLGKTVEELTASEKVMATYNAVMQEGSRINELADQVDSTSVKVAKLKTEWKEFTEVLKESLAIIVVSGDDTEESMAQTYFAVKSVLDLDVEERTQLINSLTGSLKGWGVILSGAMLFLKESISGAFERIKYFAQVVPLAFDLASKSVEYFGLVIELVEAKIKGLSRKALSVSNEMAEMTKQMGAMSDALTIIMNTPFNQAPGSVFGTEFQKKFDEILESAGYIMGEQRFGKSPDTPTLDTATETSDELKKILQERAKMAGDIEYERTGKIQEINRDHVDKMKDIARKLADALADIDRDLANKLSDLAQDRADKLLDIAQDLADKIADIDQDLADKLSDITVDANEKRADAQDEYNKGLVDAEEEYQKKINDILRKYEASRLSALIDRDARALFEAEKARDQDLKDAQESAEEKKNEELQKLLEKLEDINRAEEQQRQDAINSAEQRRRDAQQAAERARRDALQDYERARRDAQQDADRRRREARENAAQERRDALEDQARAREDLMKWYRDKLRDLQQFHQDELQQYANQYTSINQMTGDFMDTQVNAWSSFQDVLRGNREWMGIGSPTDPTTGDSFPDWRNPSNVYVGGRCNRGSSQITQGADGRQYVCIRNQWQLFTGVGGGQSVGASGASVGIMGGGGLPSSLASGGGRIKLIIEGNGDEALTNIIKSGAYEAFLEIMD